MVKKKVLVITDSLALPRAKPELCLYEETWPVLLKSGGWDVHQLSIGGATISELIRQLEYHYYFKPDVIIVQSGIVDCAPRSLGKMESLFLNHFRITRKILSWVLPKCNSFLRKTRGIKYTSKMDFISNIEKLKRKFVDKEIYWIGILPPSEGYESIIPGITKSIIAYNKILKDEMGDSYVSMDEIPENGIMSDYIHLNSQGHLYINEVLKMKLVSSV